MENDALQTNIAAQEACVWTLTVVSLVTYFHYLFCIHVAYSMEIIEELCVSVFGVRYSGENQICLSRIG